MTRGQRWCGTDSETADDSGRKANIAVMAHGPPVAVARRWPLFIQCSEVVEGGWWQWQEGGQRLWCRVTVVVGRGCVVAMGPRHGGAERVVDGAAQQWRGGGAEGQHNGGRGVAVRNGSREHRRQREWRARHNGEATVRDRGGRSWLVESQGQWHHVALFF